jgi:hypothetical protein
MVSAISARTDDKRRYGPSHLQRKRCRPPPAAVRGWPFSWTDARERPGHHRWSAASGYSLPYRQRQRSHPAQRGRSASGTQRVVLPDIGATRLVERPDLGIFVDAVEANCRQAPTRRRSRTDGSTSDGRWGHPSRSDCRDRPRRKECCRRAGLHHPHHSAIDVGAAFTAGELLFPQLSPLSWRSATSLPSSLPRTPRHWRPAWTVAAQAKQAARCILVEDPAALAGAAIQTVDATILRAHHDEIADDHRRASTSEEARLPSVGCHLWHSRHRRGRPAYRRPSRSPSTAGPPAYNGIFTLLVAPAEPAMVRVLLFHRWSCHWRHRSPPACRRCWRRRARHRRPTDADAHHSS